MKKSTIKKLLGYGRFTMLAVVVLFLYLDFVVLESIPIGFALLGKYVQPIIGLAVMQYASWKLRNDTQ